MDYYEGGILSEADKEYYPVGLPGGFFIYEATEDERILFADENVIHMYGCDTMEEFREYTGNTFQGMVYEEDLYKIQNEIQAQTMFGEKRHDYVRYRIKTKGGDLRYIEDFGHLLHGASGNKFFYVFIVDVDRDEFLNRSKNSFAEAQVLSMNQETDSLTGLFNMSFFYQRVQSILETPEGRRERLAFVHFDIPNFKLYNERHGFRMGDELLCEVAKSLHEIFGDGTVARFSDDHFVVCISSNDDDEVLLRIDKFFKAILTHPDANKRVRIKAGVYYMEDTHSEVGLACDHARLACNSIKERHDTNMFVYDEMLRERLRKQQYVVDHIDEAVKKEYIHVFYQPVIRVETGKICGYEALVRWIDPVLGFLNPGDFIETLEQFHLIHIVDCFVIEQVCKDYQKMKLQGEPLVPVSINLSRLDFELTDVFDSLEATRRVYDVPASYLDLEITESALTDKDDFLKNECIRLREAGYKLWLDDFGSGYSSLNTLTEFEFDVLKLDLVFLRSYDKNPKADILMTFIVEGARGMGLEPLTEGVETEVHYAFLKSIGCVRAQGYYFGKPQEMEDTRQESRDKGYEWEETGLND
ncbi:MAG: GGDEF and EAL domain-containing protein [Eubacterium sp.]|nr:GGDEF and EAL domain-containing protein [Eubacterium sp.]